MKNFDHVSQTDWARLAAYIDGEGSISIEFQLHKQTGRSQSHLFLTVTNTDPRLVIWCKHNFGGCLTNPDRRNRRGCHPLFHWKQWSGGAAEILRRCMPYLLIKQEQAQVALRFRATFPLRTYGLGKLSKDVSALRLSLAKQLKSLRTTVPIEAYENYKKEFVQ